MQLCLCSHGKSNYILLNLVIWALFEVTVECYFIENFGLILDKVLCVHIATMIIFVILKLNSSKAITCPSPYYSLLGALFGLCRHRFSKVWSRQHQSSMHFHKNSMTACVWCCWLHCLYILAGLSKAGQKLQVILSVKIFRQVDKEFYVHYASSSAGKRATVHLRSMSECRLLHQHAYVWYWTRVKDMERHGREEIVE